MLTRTCKTCKRPIEAGQIRCDAHEAELQRWLQQDGERDRPDVYQPRRNGVATGLPEWRTARRGLRKPRPGEELNFDED